AFTVQDLTGNFKLKRIGRNLGEAVRYQSAPQRLHVILENATLHCGHYDGQARLISASKRKIHRELVCNRAFKWCWQSIAQSRRELAIRLVLPSVELVGAKD